jgi:hypothetical protein
MKKIYLYLICVGVSIHSLEGAYRCTGCYTKKFDPPKEVALEPVARGYPYGYDWWPAGEYRLARFRDGWPMAPLYWGNPTSRDCGRL